MVNINQFMKQAQSMQKKMEEMQQESANKEYVGKSGGGLVSITMSGNGIMRKVKVDQSLLNIEEGEMLEDLIVAAHNEARQKSESESQSSISSAFGGMQLPPGFKAPF